MPITRSQLSIAAIYTLELIRLHMSEDDMTALVPLRWHTRDDETEYVQITRPSRIVSCISYDIINNPGRVEYKERDWKPLQVVLSKAQIDLIVKCGTHVPDGYEIWNRDTDYNVIYHLKIPSLDLVTLNQNLELLVLH